MKNKPHGITTTRPARGLTKRGITMSDDEMRAYSVQVCMKCNDAEKKHLKARNQRLEKRNNWLLAGCVGLTLLCMFMGAAIGI